MPIITSENLSGGPMESPSIIGTSNEAGNAKSKVYNPLSGIELTKVIVYKTDQWLNRLDENEKERLSKFPSTPSRLINFIEDQLLAHPDLTDTIGYPKADVHWKLQLEVYTAYTEIRYWLMIKLYPQEENRSVTSKMLYKLESQHENRDRVEPIPGENPVQLTFEDHFNCDEIPPDAIRILTDQPVLVQKKIANSTGVDESPNSILDVPTNASPQMKQAVEKAFHWRQPDEDKSGAIPTVPTEDSINIQVQPKPIAPGGFQPVEKPKAPVAPKPVTPIFKSKK